MSHDPPQYPPGPQGPYPPYGPHAFGPDPALVGGVGLRLLARLLDGVFLLVLLCVLGVPMVMLASLAESGSGTRTAVSVACVVLIMVVSLAYEPWATARYGRTLGKRLCKLRVARIEDGGNLSHGRAWGRSLVGVLINNAACVPIDSMWCLWDQPYRQCLHDKVVRSVVVRTD
ncbi:RDD family protein [Streptomyces sp. URMC 123]|uniref:RDD family protein n=1 Tax=Streptomyces sp. URMC 123 TaxID=3423403 RepID=UPI003F1BC6B1